MNKREICIIAKYKDFIFFYKLSSAAAEERFKVVFDYVPVNADELGLKKGDIVMITNKDVCDGWWQGTCNGKTGVFPNNFVEAVGVADVAQKEKVRTIVYAFLNCLISVLVPIKVSICRQSRICFRQL